MNRVVSLLLALFFLSPQWCISQDDTPDSLKAILPSTSGKARLDVLLQLAGLYADQFQLMDALPYAAEAKRLAEQFGNQHDLGTALTIHGRALIHTGNDSTGLIETLQGIAVYEKAGDIRAAAKTYIDLGHYAFNERKPEAIAYQFRALKLYESVLDTPGMANAHLQIGFYSIAIRNLAEAGKNLTKARDYLMQINDPGMLATVNQRLGMYYRNIKQFDQALAADSLALAYHLQHQQLFSAGWVYASMARTYELAAISMTPKAVSPDREDQLLKALACIAKAVSTFTNIGYPETDYAMMKSMAIRGSILYHLNRYRESRIELERSLRLATAISHPEILQDATEYLAKLDSMEGNWQQALHRYQQYIFYRDANLSDESIREGMTSTMEYERDKALLETQLENARQEAADKRLRLILLIGILVLFLAAIFLFLYSRQKQLATKKIESAYHALQLTQAQLVHAEKMASLGELTAGIAHEIQNPLNFVNNFAEVNAELIDELRQELVTGNMQLATDVAHSIKENEEKIIFHGKRADSIVKSMLQHSRSGSGQKELTDINALVDEYLRLAYHGMRAKDKSFNVELKTDFDPSVGKINIVPQDIGRVVLNIITNAFYALNTSMPPQGGTHKAPVVRISTTLLPPLGGKGADAGKPTPTGKGVEIRITDNGPGMSKTVLDKIFQPFFTTKPTGQGTGLGLSISHDIIKAHGGELKVESVEGEGSTFTILLPVQ